MPLPCVLDDDGDLGIAGLGAVAVVARDADDLVVDDGDDRVPSLVVEDAWHRNGIATRLGYELSKAAHRRGIERFTATVSADNRAIATFVGSLPVHATWVWNGGERQLAIPLARHIAS